MEPEFRKETLEVPSWIEEVEEAQSCHVTGVVLTFNTADRALLGVGEPRTWVEPCCKN